LFGALEVKNVDKHRSRRIKLYH